MTKVTTEQLEVHCGQALIDHYADNPHQTFHHEPSVAAVVLDAVPDGWAKIDGEWREVKRIGHEFKRKLDLPCDCPERTSWDPHYTCVECGSYDTHTIHGADYRSWREV